jgi:WD40 repeat protein
VLAITPDGTSILVGTHIGIMRYDAHTTQLSPLLPTGARVERLAISADGATFASAQLDGSIIIWSLADGSRLHVLDARAPRRGLIELLTEPSFFQRIESLAFSPDGTLLASDSGNGQIRLWDVTSGELLARLGEGDRRTSSLAFSPDGALLAAGGGWQSGRGNKGDLAVWDVAQRRLRFSLEGHTNVVQGLDFSADGTELASADEDGGIRRWRMTDGTLIEERPLEAQVTLLTGGWYLAEDGDGTPWVFATADARPAFPLDRSPAWRDGPLVAAAGTTLAILGDDDLLARWDLPTGAALGGGQLPEHGLRIGGLAITPDGVTLLIGRGNGAVTLRQTHDGVPMGELRAHEEAVMSVVLSPDGSLAAVGSEDGTLSIWRPADRTLLQRLDVSVSWVRGVDFSPDGALVATIGIRRERTFVSLWRVADGALLWAQDTGEEIGDVVRFAPDGTALLAGFWDGSVHQWRVADGTLLGTIREPPQLRDRIRAIVLSPDGSSAALILGYRNLELWSTENWTRRHSYEGEVGHPEAVAFSSDGQLLVTGSSIDNVVQVWNVAGDRRPLATLRGHTWSVEAVGFTPDQRHVISASADGTVRLWAVADP